MKNKNRLYFSALWAFVLSACGKSTRQPAGDGAPSASDRPQSPKKGGGSRHFGAPSTLLAFILAACGGGGDSMRAASSTMPMDNGNDNDDDEEMMEEDPIISGGNKGGDKEEDEEDEEDEEPEDPVTPPPPQNSDPNHGQAHKPRDALDAYVPPERAIDRYFTFKADEIADDDKPVSDLARHLISGYAFAMPSKGPLVITWRLNEDYMPDRGVAFVDTPEEIAEAKRRLQGAFDVFEAVINVRFEETTADNAYLRINFDSDEFPSQAAHPKWNAEREGEVVITLRPHPFGEDLDNLAHAVIEHELGHALGLDHPWEKDNGWSQDLSYRRGSQNYDEAKAAQTIMAYARLAGELQDADIEALQWLYGAAPSYSDATVSREGVEQHLNHDLTRHRRFAEQDDDDKIFVNENVGTDYVVVDIDQVELVSAFLRHTDSVYALVEDYGDNHLFEIDEDDGELRFKDNPDYENPHDTAGGAKYGYNNICEVRVVERYSVRPWIQTLNRIPEYGPAEDSTHESDFYIQVVDII